MEIKVILTDWEIEQLQRRFQYVSKKALTEQEIAFILFGSDAVRAYFNVIRRQLKTEAEKMEIPFLEEDC